MWGVDTHNPLVIQESTILSRNFHEYLLDTVNERNSPCHSITLLEQGTWLVIKGENLELYCYPSS